MAARPTKAPAGVSKRSSPAVGAMVLSGANVVRLAVQLSLLPVLARLVGPTEYGLVSLAVPFVLLCNVLSDGGLGPALARRQDPPWELESTVFWLAGGVGSALALGSCLLAWPIGHALHQPRLPLLIIALSPILVLSGFTAAANARVIRDSRFGVFAAGDLISTAASGAAALTAAFHGWGAWSLAVQQLVLWTCKFAWVVRASRLPVRFHCRPKEARDLMRFGRHNIGASLGDFVTRNLDNVIVGGALGALALGYYAMAYQIIRVPDLVISGPLYLYIFSGVAGAVGGRSGRSPAAISLAALRLAATSLAPLFAGLGLLAGPAVELVLGPRWRGATEALAWLSVAGLGFSLSSVAAAILMGLGRSELQFRMAMVSGVVTVIAVASGVAFGVAAVGAAVAGVTLVLMFGYLAILAGALHIRPASLFVALWPATLGTAALTLSLIATQRLLAGSPPLVVLTVSAATGAGVYLLVVLVCARRTLIADLREFRAAHDPQEPALAQKA